MPEATDTPRALYEDLDTAYVNLEALIAYLRERAFTGLVRVELDEYGADVSLRAGEEPSAREREGAAQSSVGGDSALERLLARAREPGGLVTIYEGEPEEVERNLAGRFGAGGGLRGSGPGDSEEDENRRELMEVAGELLASIERATLVAGGDFEAALHAARLGLAEDYPFLDPFARRFEYAAGVVSLDAQPGERLFVSGVCEMLRRAVGHVATAEQKLGVRKDAARELSVLIRRRRSKLERFNLARRQLERIAGMKLL